METKIISLTSNIKTPITDLAVNTVISIFGNFAIIFDPSAKVEEIDKIVGKRKVLAVILTHGHWDHVFTLSDCIKKYNCKCYLHSNAIKKLGDCTLNCATTHKLDFVVKDTEKINFIELKDNAGKIKLPPFFINYYYTPGHSDCSVSYFMGNNIISGDVLRLHKLARVNLPTSDIEKLKITIDFFKTQAQNMTIYGGHDEPDTLVKYLENARFK